MRLEEFSGSKIIGWIAKNTNLLIIRPFNLYINNKLIEFDLNLIYTRDDVTEVFKSLNMVGYHFEILCSNCFYDDNIKLNISYESISKSFSEYNLNQLKWDKCLNESKLEDLELIQKQDTLIKPIPKGTYRLFSFSSGIEF